MNPFAYQGPVSPADLIDRKQELYELQKNVANRVNTRVAAPRRFGKTSLIDAHLAKMQEMGYRTLSVDFYRVATLNDVAHRMLDAYAPVFPATRELTSLVQRGIGLSVGTRGINATLSQLRETSLRISADAARALLLELLDLPAKAHQRDGQMSVICFDEFQDLLTADDKVDGLFRSVIQKHRGAATYIYAGSSPSLMQELFSNQERPFYGQARPLDLPPLPFDETFEELEEKFRLHDRGASEDDLAHLVAFAQGHPQRTMMLAHHFFDCLEEGMSEPLQTAIDRSVAEIESASAAIWDSLTRAEKSVVAALADGMPPTGTVTARQHAISRPALQRALKSLVTQQHLVVKRDLGYEHLDPLFAEWLRRR